MTLSPWLIELQRDRPVTELRGRADAQVTIVGGGIAGMSTAYFLLKETSYTIALVEKSMVGHGASGHNGGQGVSGLERPLTELVHEKGGKAMADLLWAMEGGYQLIEDLCGTVGYRGVKVNGKGLIGYQDGPSLERALDEFSLRLKIGAPTRDLIIADDLSGDVNVPTNIQGLIRKAPRAEISQEMRAKDEYLGCSAVPVTLLNSAQLCEDIAVHLLATFPDRFLLFEGSHVREVDARVNVVTSTSSGSIVSDLAVMCINGYPIPRMMTSRPTSVEEGSRQFLASMIAYRPEGTDRTGALIFHHDGGSTEEEPYFYLTRRPTRYGNAELVAVGGPQVLFDGEPEGDQEIPSGVYERIDDFVSRTYEPRLPEFPELFWNGLMGYTQDGLRMVGQDRRVPRIWYNLGCNGIGLLPSVVGGMRLASMMKGRNIEDRTPRS